MSDNVFDYKDKVPFKKPDFVTVMLVLFILFVISNFGWKAYRKVNSNELLVGKEMGSYKIDRVCVEEPSGTVDCTDILSKVYLLDIKEEGQQARKVLYLR